VRRLPFLLGVTAVAVTSFLWLAARSRPPSSAFGVEPLLYASGLHQPRGLAVGADGALYVAEGGWSGPGQATVPGRVTRVPGRDQTQVVLDGLPASETAQPLFAHSGPGAVVSDGSGLVLFIGPAEGRPQGSVVRLSPIGVDPSPAEPLVLEGSPPLTPSPAAVWGAERGPDGRLSAVLPQANLLARVEPGTGHTVPVTPFIGAGASNPFPSGVTRSLDGTMLVTHFGSPPFPALGQPPGGRLVQVAQDGRWQPLLEGLRFPVAVALAPNGLLYVLEFASGYDAAGERFLPRSGRVVAIGPEPTRRRTVVRDVDYPTALAFAPNGDLYVTEGGAFRGPGEGRILLVPGQSLRAIQ
jgi:hypothetical protein